MSGVEIGDTWCHLLDDFFEPLGPLEIAALAQAVELGPEHLDLAQHVPRRLASGILGRHGGEIVVPVRIVRHHPRDREQAVVDIGPQRKNLARRQAEIER